MRARVYLAAGVLAVLAVGACSGGGSGGTANGVNRAGSQAGGLSAGGAGSADGRMAPAAGAPTAPTHGSTGGQASTAGGGSSATLVADDGIKIRTAEMTVAVKGARNVATKANAAESIARGVGGDVDSDDRTSGPQASATLRLRVPPDTLDNTLTALSKLGREMSRQSSTTDVTQKVADVASRVSSAKGSINRLRLLFAHAVKIGDIIAIESELNSREADLESLQAQQRALDQQTAMATITLSLVTAPKHHPQPAPPKHEKKRGGFLGGLQRGWDGFTAAAVWVAAAVGVLLPFLVLLLALALGVRLVWPRLPHHRARPAPAPNPSE